MSLHSKFRFWALLPAVLLLLVTGIIFFVTVKVWNRPSSPSLGVFFFFTLLIFTWIWLVFGELRTKIIKVKIHDDKIIVSNYFGLGAGRTFSMSQFDGLETALLPSRYNTYENLYLIENGKKAIKLSQFYHKNYADLKITLTEKIKDLGQKDFTAFQEVKEIFI